MYLLDFISFHNNIFNERNNN